MKKILISLFLFMLLIVSFGVVKKLILKSDTKQEITQIENNETIQTDTNTTSNTNQNIENTISDNVQDGNSESKETSNTNETQNTEISNAEENSTSNNKDMFFDTNSLLLIANKKHPLPDGYKPNDLVKPNVKSSKNDLYLRKEASLALEEMFESAKNDGIYLVLISSFRSYEYQRNLYNRYVQKDGEEKANKYSSKPGESEHQTGLAVDIGDNNGEYYLKQSFKDTKEGIWLKENAYKFGFILRYMENKENITGYIFEPWHFRYIGKEEAEKVYNSNLTLEEYYNILD